MPTTNTVNTYPSTQGGYNAACAVADPGPDRACRMRAHRNRQGAAEFGDRRDARDGLVFHDRRAPVVAESETIMRTIIIAAAVAAIPTLASAQYGAAPSPGYGAPPPGDGAAAPGYGTAQPGYGTASPSYGTAQPGYGTASPGPSYGGNYPYRPASPSAARPDMPSMASSRLDPENCGTPDEPKACPPMPRRPLLDRPANRE